MNIQRFESRYLRFQSTCLWTEEGTCILIDPGVLPEDALRVQDFLNGHQLTVEALLFTHTHGDHFACWNAFAGARTWGSYQIALKAEARKANDVKYVYSIWRKFKIDAPWEVTFPRMDVLLTDSTPLPFSTCTMVFYETPGHSTDHSICILPDHHILFSGDMLIQIPQPFILQGFRKYYQSLLKLEQLIQSFNITTVYPGHGPALTTAKTIHHQLEREKQYIRQVVEKANSLLKQDISEDQLQEELLTQFSVNNTILHSHRVNINTLLREIEHDGPILLPESAD